LAASASIFPLAPFLVDQHLVAVLHPRHDGPADAVIEGMEPVGLARFLGQQAVELLVTGKIFSLRPVARKIVCSPMFSV
jgi:hypothetical protein